MTTNQQPVALVVAEANSRWAEWVERWQRESRDVVLIVQQPDEDAAQLGSRVRTRVRQMPERGEQLEKAALLGGPLFRSTLELTAAVSDQLAPRALHVAHADRGSPCIFDHVA